MSYTQKNLSRVLDELNLNQAKQAREIEEMKHIKSLFHESEKAKAAKEVAWSDEFSSIKQRFSKFFYQKPEGSGGRT